MEMAKDGRIIVQKQYVVLDLDGAVICDGKDAVIDLLAGKGHKNLSELEEENKELKKVIKEIKKELEKIK